MKAFAAFATIGLFFANPVPAHALCSYDGVDNAKTTIAQEFRDSKWVVKAKVLSAKDHFIDDSDDGFWTIYQLEVEHAFKGKPPKHLRFYTPRNSGGFYMDRPSVNLPAGHDIGGEYLLFLNPKEYAPGMPREAKGSVFVNYSCGRSDKWRKIGPAARRQLAGLQSGR